MTADTTLDRSVASDVGPSDRDCILTMSHSRGEHPTLVLALGGELDISTAPALLEYTGSALRGRGRTTTLILDLTELGFVSAAGVRAVNMICASAAKARMRTMVVAPGRGPLGRLLEAGARAVLGEVFETRRAAIAAAGRTAARPAQAGRHYRSGGRSTRAKRRSTVREMSAVPA